MTVERIRTAGGIVTLLPTIRAGDGSGPQLGNGTTTNRTIPTQTSTPARRISARFEFAIALPLNLE